MITVSITAGDQEGLNLALQQLAIDRETEVKTSHYDRNIHTAFALDYRSNA